LGSFLGVAAAAAFSVLLTGAVNACAAAALSVLWGFPVFGPFVSVSVHLFVLVVYLVFSNK